MKLRRLIPGVLPAFSCAAGLCLFGGFAIAQSDSGESGIVTAPPDSQNDVSSRDSQDQRLLGVLPNHNFAESSAPFHPIGPKDKFTIAMKDAFDYPGIPLSAGFALIYQIENANPSFGQGMKGYGRRFAASYSDQVIADVMAEGAIPSLFHQDPRYFRLGSGSVMHRTLYALTRIVVAHSDTGKWTFNYGEWIGNSAAIAISNAYYPDSRDAAGNASRLGMQVGTDVLTNVLKEFWPDIRNKMHRHKDAASLDAP